MKNHKKIAVIMVTMALITLAIIISMNNHDEDKKTGSGYEVKGSGSIETYVNTRLLEHNMINSETIGWIAIQDTIIDYPIMHTTNNDFYLDHNPEKKPSAAGSIFMDFRNKGIGIDRHTILYGHSMKDGTMFRALFEFKKKDFFYSHRILEIDTLNSPIRWEIFSAYVTDRNFYYIHTNFKSDADYLAFIDTIHKKSKFNTALEFTKDDKLLTLSTCSYEFEDAMFVIHAKRID